MSWSLILVVALALPPYDREEFGGWRVVGHGPQECSITAREAVIIRDSLVVNIAGRLGKTCVITTAKLLDQYSGDISVVSGREIDVDHVIPLAYAWRNGAAWWPPAKRSAFANDPRNLTATTRKANRSKGDKDPSAWTPSSRCEYLARWETVRRAYGLGEKFGVCR